MSKNAPLVIIAAIILTTVTTSYFITQALTTSDLAQNTPPDYKWLLHGLLNLIGYSTVLLPGYLTYKYIRKINFINKSGNNLSGALIRTLFGEEDLSITNPSTQTHSPQRTPLQDAAHLAFYFLGLQASYLTWGVLQEKVMTQEYTSPDGTVEHFKDSQFLVFVNRILAFFVSGGYLLWKRQPRHRCPLYKYVFCSISNILSSWCQYEALLYVAFPHQVLAKAAKTIPVMVMGRFVFRSKYEYFEYVTAVILSAGMLLFTLDVGNDRATSTVTTLSGGTLLVLYIVFDSFTSNWQGALFKTYHMKPVQMMCFVNLFSCVFTLVSLLQQGSLVGSVYFISKYPRFIVDCFLLSLCSATGQLFIFSTISNFGPVVFAIITTIRQALSVLLSCLIYNHQVNAVGAVGVLLIFLSVFVRIYCAHRLKAIRKNQSLIGIKA